MCQLIPLPILLSSWAPHLKLDALHRDPSGLAQAECLLNEVPVHQQPNFGYILSKRLKEVSSHSSHVTVKRDAAEPGINHFFFFFFWPASTPLPSLKEVGAEVAQNPWAGEAERGEAHTRLRAPQRLETQGCHTPPTARATACSSQQKRSPLDRMATGTVPRISQTPNRISQRPPRVGPRAAWQPQSRGLGEGPPRRRAAHAQCRAPARLPTVGTAKPRSPALAASPEPLATSTRRELRP